MAVVRRAVRKLLAGVRKVWPSVFEDHWIAVFVGLCVALISAIAFVQEKTRLLPEETVPFGAIIAFAVFIAGIITLFVKSMTEFAHPAGTGVVVERSCNTRRARVWYSLRGNEVVQGKRTPISSHKSVAISPDGRLLATLIGENLQFYSVDTKSGELFPYRSQNRLDHQNARLLAIAPRGDCNVWWAYCYENRGSTYLCRGTFEGSQLMEKSWRLGEVKDQVMVYAAFLGSDLVYCHSETKLGCVSIEGSNSKQRDQQATVFALDAVSVGSGTYLVLLLGERGNGSPRERLIKRLEVRKARDLQSRDLQLITSLSLDRSRSTHLTLARVPEGACQSILAFHGDELGLVSKEIDLKGNSAARS